MNDVDLQKAARERVHMITPETLSQWLADGTCVLVDVREAVEYAHGHIEGAHLVPLSSFTRDQVTALAVPHKKLVFHCRSANRCGSASLIMLEEGYEGEIYRLQGGFLYWQQKNLPVAV